MKHISNKTINVNFRVCISMEISARPLHFGEYWWWEGGEECVEVILLSLFANVGNNKNMPTAKKKCIVQYLNA